MHNIMTRPPRLGLTLLLSTVLSTAMVVLRCISEPTMTPGSFLPAFMATNSAYYLVCYFQRRRALKRAALAGEDTWPVVPLFPAGGNMRPELTTSTGFSIWCLLAFNQGILPTRERIRRSDGGFTRASIALLVVYLLGLVISTVVYIQARRVRKVEDNAVCELSHKMRCQKCGVNQADLGKPQAAFSSDFHRRTINKLPMSMSLSLVLCGALFALEPAGRDPIWALIAVTALAAAHRLFFIIRAKLAPPVDWPSSRLFPGKVARRTFQAGNFLVYQASILAMWYSFHDDRLGWRAGQSARMVLIAQLLDFVAHCVVGIYGGVMHNAEQWVECAREGHSWKCVRHCSIAQDPEAIPTVPKIVDEKNIGDVVKEKEEVLV